jgi:hydroxymethylbilane synthase
MIARELEATHPNLKVELVIITTSGDQIQDRPLHEFGGKGLFTKELELALLRHEVDFAVHSFKDVPVTMPLVDIADLIIASVPEREDPRDVLASPSAKSLADLPRAARVGTSSLRRQAQILALRPDLTLLPIRGNIDTRLRKLQSGQYDAIILALAGTRRAGLFDPALMTPIPEDQLLPAAGQGALALQCRRDNPGVQQILTSLNHPPTAQAADLERQIVRLLNGDCHSPIAALATFSSTTLTLRAAVAARDGHPPVIKAHTALPITRALEAPQLLYDQLAQQGAQKLLAG